MTAMTRRSENGEASLFTWQIQSLYICTVRTLKLGFLKRQRWREREKNISGINSFYYWESWDRVRTPSGFHNLVGFLVRWDCRNVVYWKWDKQNRLWLVKVEGSCQNQAILGTIRLVAWLFLGWLCGLRRTSDQVEMSLVQRTQLSSWITVAMEATCV